MRSEQIIVALDNMNKERAITLAWTLSSSVWGFKISDLLIEHGLQIIRDLKCLGNVFVDVKLYDTPYSIKSNIIKIDDAGADFITVHASSGKEALQEAVNVTRNAKILAVTTLPTMDEATVQEIYFRSLQETVIDLAITAFEAGVHGLICHSYELDLIKHLDMIKVVYGESKFAADYYIVDNT